MPRCVGVHVEVGDVDQLNWPHHFKCRHNCTYYFKYLSFNKFANFFTDPSRNILYFIGSAIFFGQVFSLLALGNCPFSLF